jgi:hypothetical protein
VPQSFRLIRSVSVGFSGVVVFCRRARRQGRELKLAVAVRGRRCWRDRHAEQECGVIEDNARGSRRMSIDHPTLDKRRIVVD